MGLICRLPTDKDIWQLGERLRAADREELAAVCDLSAHEAVVARMLAVRRVRLAHSLMWRGNGIGKILRSQFRRSISACAKRAAVR